MFRPKQFFRETIQIFSTFLHKKKLFLNLIKFRKVFFSNIRFSCNYIYFFFYWISIFEFYLWFSNSISAVYKFIYFISRQEGIPRITQYFSNTIGYFMDALLSSNFTISKWRYWIFNRTTLVARWRIELRKGLSYGQFIIFNFVFH